MRKNQEKSLGLKNSTRLPRVLGMSRSGKALHTAALGHDRDVLGINLTAGCVHRCSFCSTRAHTNYYGDEIVYLYDESPLQLAEELDALKRLPRAILISPDIDPFPPVGAVQRVASACAKAVAERGIEAWLMTRGFIRPAILKTLYPFREHLRLIVGMTTLNRSWQRLLEPLAAPPTLRLRQMRDMTAAGFKVQIAVEPLIPGLTDRRENLLPLLESLSDAGIRRVHAGYMFLRTGIEAQLTPVLESLECAEDVLAEYEDGPYLGSGPAAPARYLPKRRRQRGYAALMALAAPFGIDVRISSGANPDFSVPQTSQPLQQPRVPLRERFEAARDLLCSA
jgi:DNA repair photolyase